MNNYQYTFYTDNLPYEKVGKNEPVCIADEVPFEIPESWEWVRLGSIGETNIGLTYKPSDKVDAKSGTAVLRSNNIQKGKMDYSDMVYVSCNVPERAMISKGDILICARNGSRALVGKSAIVDMDGMAFGAFMAKYTSLLSGMINPYILTFIESPVFRGQLDGVKTETINQITQEMIKEQLIPIPPLAEQIRINEKLEELMPYIEKYGVAYLEATKLNETFPDMLKKSILQEAVQGKLVPQDPADEPASVLLERIRAEKEQLIKDGKIKRDKHKSVIFRRDNSHYEKLDGVERCIDDEIPFKIPDTWVWSRIRNICTDIVDCPHSTPKYYPEDTGFYSIDTTCINSDGTIQGFRYVDENAYASRTVRLSPQKSDIVYTREGSIGRAAVIPDIDNICLGQRVMLLRVFALINTSLYQQILMSPVVLDAITGKTRGIGAKHINVSDVCNALVPVPPLGEQARIIAALSTVLPMLKSI